MLKKNPLPSDTFQVSQDFCTALHFGVAADHKSTLSAEVKCGQRKKADVTHILVTVCSVCCGFSQTRGAQAICGREFVNVANQTEEALELFCGKLGLQQSGGSEPRLFVEQDEI